jgi:NAD kinase
MIQVWPIVDDINTIGSDVSRLLQQRIDIVYTFGGDGTLLTLLKALYTHNDNVEIPRIAAFNLVSNKLVYLLKIIFLFRDL